MHARAPLIKKTITTIITSHRQQQHIIPSRFLFFSVSVLALTHQCTAGRATTATSPALAIAANTPSAHLREERKVAVHIYKDALWQGV
jgi:hypothetical protein